MAPVLHLDLSVNAQYTECKGSLVKGIDGHPMRVAHCVSNNKAYIQIFAHNFHEGPHGLREKPEERDPERPLSRAEKIDQLVEKGTVVHVSGHGYWTAEKDLSNVVAFLK